MLLIKYAYNADNSIVYPCDAQRGVNYFCPKCKAPVIVKQGKIRRHHFAHKFDTSCQGPESYTDYLSRVLHSACIEGIYSNLSVHSEALEQDDWLKIMDICSKCQRDFNPRYFRPHNYNHVCLEYSLLDSEYRADIALLQDGKLKGIIEVRHTHAVDDKKWAFLNENKIPCIEISAEKMKEHAPSLILCVLKSNVENLRGEFRRNICPNCDANIPIPPRRTDKPKPSWQVKPEYVQIPPVVE